MRLGRLPHDPAAVAAAPSLAGHRYAAMAPPATLDRSGIPFRPQLRHNDVWPDCVAVGLLNGMLAVEALNTGGDLNIAPDVEVPFYAACAGCEPTPAAIAATDGLVVLDALRHQAVHGFDIGGVNRMVADFGTVPLTRAAIAASMATFGCAYLGVDLHQRDMDTIGGVWDAGNSDPGTSVGGHCLLGWSYTGLTSDDTVLLATWGALQPVTWRWMDSRLREAYALLWPQLRRADGTDWDGADLDVLRADLAKWRAA